MMEEYSAIKRDKLLLHATTWMNLQKIMLSEIVPKGNILYDSVYVIPLT